MTKKWTNRSSVGSVDSAEKQGVYINGKKINNPLPRSESGDTNLIMNRKRTNNFATHDSRRSPGPNMNREKTNIYVPNDNKRGSVSNMNREKTNSHTSSDNKRGSGQNTNGEKVNIRVPTDNEKNSGSNVNRESTDVLTSADNTAYSGFHTDSKYVNGSLLHGDAYSCALGALENGNSHSFGSIKRALNKNGEEFLKANVYCANYVVYFDEKYVVYSKNEVLLKNLYISEYPLLFRDNLLIYNIHRSISNEVPLGDFYAVDGFIVSETLYVVGYVFRTSPLCQLRLFSIRSNKIELVRVIDFPFYEIRSMEFDINLSSIILCDPKGLYYLNYPIDNSKNPCLHNLLSIPNEVIRNFSISSKYLVLLSDENMYLFTKDNLSCHSVRVTCPSQFFYNDIYCDNYNCFVLLQHCDDFQFFAIDERETRRLRELRAIRKPHGYIVYEKTVQRICISGGEELVLDLNSFNIRKSSTPQRR